MSITTPPPTAGAATPPVPVRRFTVDEYHRMIRAGVFAEDERFELLEGWIVPKMTRNPPHDVAIVLLHALLASRIGEGWHVRNQSAISTADSEPEPDLVVVRGGARDYVGRHPGPGDVGLVIEVADSTLVQDRGLKRRLYARAGISVFWIINLIDGRVEVDSDPTGPAAVPGYRHHQDFGADESAPFVIGGRDVGPIAVRDLLP